MMLSKTRMATKLVNNYRTAVEEEDAGVAGAGGFICSKCKVQ